MLLQVDQHTETIRMRCRGQEDAPIAASLARKAPRPKEVILVGSDNDSSSAAMAALLATGQHNPMFQRVQWLKFEGSFPDHLEQVIEKPPISNDSVCDRKPTLAWSA
jgi:hypothetical protein